ncbi:MAG: FMN-binding protein [Gammaproteobacteria bacterium]|nr:FMN-binding protein [Gammaproteobacteria bacterium]
MKRLFSNCVLWLALVSSACADTYQSPEDFLRETFAGTVPKPAVLWLTGAVREQTKAILGHEPSQLRVRYWQQGQRSAWILDEIGKEKPITTGIVIDANRIERIRVLAFRESRGWEVRHSFFTDQFKQRGLTEDQKLDGPIDGISGATLSVRALTNLARLALYFHRQIPATTHVTP